MLRICALFVLLSLPLAALADPAGRVRVIDGDTFEVGGETVRLFGIDAVETEQTCQTEAGQAWACGAWITDEVRSRYQGHRATCTTRDVDRYGRIVATCQIDGRDVGRALVRDGLAFAYRRYSMRYDLDEKGAAIARRGLHDHLVQRPAEFRRTGTPPPPAQTATDCVIKGNISSKGTRIYHVPGQEHYGRTRINTGKGERWFCTEADARAAGWRRAKN